MYSKHSRINARALYLIIAGCGTFATSIIFAINLIYQIEIVKLNPLQLVLVGTTLEGACFLFQVPTGVLADIYSRRLSVVIGYSLMGLGFLLEGLIPTFFVVLLAQVLWGCGSTFVSGAEEAWCADEIGATHVGAVFMRGTQIGQLAGLLAIPVSIWLGTYRLNVPVVTGAALLLLLGLFLLFFMPEQHFQPTPRAERSSWHMLLQTMVDGGKTIKRNRMLWMILGITAFAAMASEGFDRLQTDHFIQDFTFPTLGHLQPLIWFGIITAGARLLTLAMTEIVRRRSNTNNQSTLIRIMFGCNLLLLLGTVIFALTGNFYLALAAFWLAMVGRTADQPLYNTWITQNTESRGRATIYSMLGQVDAIGQIAGGPAVGYIGTLVSLRAALLTTSAILSPCTLFFIGALRLDGEQSQATLPLEKQKDKWEV